MSFEIIKDETFIEAANNRYILLYKDAIYDDYKLMKEKITAILEEWAEPQKLSLSDFCLMTIDVDNDDDDTTWINFVENLAKEFDCKVKFIHRKGRKHNLFATDEKLDADRRYFIAKHMLECGNNPLAIIFNSEKTKGNSDTRDMINLMMKFDLKFTVYEYRMRKMVLLGKNGKTFSNFKELSNSECAGDL